jgi:hypothetical protein
MRDDPMAVISGYRHYLGLAGRLQWDAERIDLS